MELVLLLVRTVCRSDYVNNSLDPRSAVSKLADAPKKSGVLRRYLSVEHIHFDQQGSEVLQDIVVDLAVPSLQDLVHPAEAVVVLFMAEQLEVFIVVLHLEGSEELDDHDLINFVLLQRSQGLLLLSTTSPVIEGLRGILVRQVALGGVAEEVLQEL